MKKFCIYGNLSIASITFLPSLGHGLGRNAFSKIWLNFLTAKCKKKLRNQEISKLFMVDSTGLEPVTPCTSSMCSYQLS